MSSTSGTRSCSSNCRAADDELPAVLLAGTPAAVLVAASSGAALLAGAPAAMLTAAWSGAAVFLTVPAAVLLAGSWPADLAAAATCASPLSDVSSSHLTAASGVGRR
jgi:hypothetical protein